MQPQFVYWNKNKSYAGVGF